MNTNGPHSSYQEKKTYNAVSSGCYSYNLKRLELLCYKVGGLHSCKQQLYCCNE